MTWQHPLFIIPSLTGWIFIITGAFMIKSPPKRINSLYGTLNSMKSQERWDFAQIYSAKVMVKWGGTLVLISLLGTINIINPIVRLVIGIGLLIGTIPILRGTEKAMKDRFGDDKFRQPKKGVIITLFLKDCLIWSLIFLAMKCNLQFIQEVGRNFETENLTRKFSER
jgi:uncharacterized membrane protein